MMFGVGVDLMHSNGVFFTIRSEVNLMSYQLGSILGRLSGQHVGLQGDVLIVRVLIIVQYIKVVMLV